MDIKTTTPTPQNTLRKSQDRPKIEHAPLQERWEVGEDTYQSTEALLQSGQTYENKTAKYSYVTQQTSVENPAIVRAGRAVVRGASGALLIGGMGATFGGAVDLLTGLGTAFEQAISPYPVAGPSLSLGATLGLVGAGVGLVLGAANGALDDPTVIDRGSMVGVLNKDEHKSTFGLYEKDKDGRFTGHIVATADLEKEALVTPRGSVSDEFLRIGLGMAAGALVGVGTGVTGRWIKGGSMVGGLAGVVGGGTLGYRTAPEDRSNLAKVGTIAGDAAALGMLGAGAGTLGGIMVGAVGSALNMGPVGHIVGGALVGGFLTSLSNMDLM